MNEPARRGKIARLPLAIREELNKRIQEGQTGRKILPWLNAIEDVQKILGEDFEGLAVNDQNLSDWRKGGYQDWLKRTDSRAQRMERTKELAKMSMELAQASGGNLAEGAATILGGSILEILEQVDELRLTAEDTQPADAEGPSKLELITAALGQITLAVSRLRKGDHSKETIRQNEERLKQAREELDLAQQKFQRETIQLFIRWVKDKRATELATTGGDNSQTIDALGQLMFQEDWKPADESRV